MIAMYKFVKNTMSPITMPVRFRWCMSISVLICFVYSQVFFAMLWKCDFVVALLCIVCDEVFSLWRKEIRLVIFPIVLIKLVIIWSLGYPCCKSPTVISSLLATFMVRVKMGEVKIACIRPLRRTLPTDFDTAKASTVCATL